MGQVVRKAYSLPLAACLPPPITPIVLAPPQPQGVPILPSPVPPSPPLCDISVIHSFRSPPPSSHLFPRPKFSPPLPAPQHPPYLCFASAGSISAAVQGMEQGTKPCSSGVVFKPGPIAAPVGEPFPFPPPCLMLNCKARGLSSPC